MPSRPRALILACLVLLGAPARGADFVGAYTWRSSDPKFGGFSGLDLAPGGRDFVAVSDHGGLVAGRLRRSDGRITGISAGTILELKDTRGAPVTTRLRDAEGLSMTGTGRLLVSFEGYARVWSYPASGGAATPLPRPRDFGAFGPNTALEALATGPDGAIYTMPEAWRDAEPTIPVWRFRDGAWTQPFAIPRRGDAYRPVGADFDDAGRLYVLERHFSGLGFSSRVRRFAIGSGAVLDDERLLETRTGDYDNLEGISVWRDAGGTLRITMISDDNFRFFQRTEFVEFRVPD